MDDEELVRQLRKLAGGQKALAERLHVDASTLRRWQRNGIPVWQRQSVTRLQSQLQREQSPPVDELDQVLARNREEIMAVLDRQADDVRDAVRAGRL